MATASCVSHARETALFLFFLNSHTIASITTYQIMDSTPGINCLVRFQLLTALNLY